VVAVADAARENLIELGISQKQIAVIVNGAEPLRVLSACEKNIWRARLGIPDGAHVVGICARLEPCKDHTTLLRAAERLRRSGKNCFFLIVGDGSLREELEKEAKRRELSSCICFTGFAEDVAPYVNLLDIHVNCSVGTETSSLAISEAMSLGVPTVASDYGGNPYMVRDGLNGLLYPVGNDAALANAISRLLDDPVLLSRLSHNARLRFERELNAECMTRKTERLYARLCSNGKRH
jgi:glycosyltransferase involved in cell wall biosynthesis